MSKKAQTLVFDLLGLIKAMHTATEFIGSPEMRWDIGNSKTVEAKEFKRGVLSCYDLVAMRLDQVPELNGWASMTADELNEILSKKGFNIRLEWEEGRGKFGVVSILDYLVEWAVTGWKTTINVYPEDQHGMPAQNVEPTRYDGFELDIADNGVKVFTVQGSNEPLVRIITKNGDLCYILQASRPEGKIELYAAIDEIRRAPRAEGYIKSLSIPMIKARHEVDISDVVGLSIGGRFVIESAKQEIRFGMNEKGARALTATGVTVGITSFNPDGDIVIDSEFLIWFERPGFDVPVFAGFFGIDDWKNPGDLNSI